MLEERGGHRESHGGEVQVEWINAVKQFQCGWKEIFHSGTRSEMKKSMCDCKLFSLPSEKSRGGYLRPEMGMVLVCSQGMVSKTIPFKLSVRC